MFFCRIPVVLENRRSSQGRGAHPLHPPPRSASVLTNHLPSSKPETKKMMVPELNEKGVHTSGLSHSFYLLSLSTTLQPSLSAISHQLSESCWGFKIWQHHSFSALHFTSVFKFRDDTSPRSTAVSYTHLTLPTIYSV